MARVMLNTLSQSSKKEHIASEIQSGAKHDVLVQNMSDEQQAAIDGENSRDDPIETKKGKITLESNNDDKQEDSNGDDLSSSLSDEGEIIPQEEDCKQPKITMMSIKVVTQKQKLLALCNTLPHNPGESKHQE
eukprot:469023-Ditylum_brightwellii.AAC.1